jgi:hypothetical protein
MIVRVNVGNERHSNTQLASSAVDFRGVRASGKQAVAGESHPLSDMHLTVGHQPTMLRMET